MNGPQYNMSVKPQRPAASPLPGTMTTGSSQIPVANASSPASFTGFGAQLAGQAAPTTDTNATLPAALSQTPATAPQTPVSAPSAATTASPSLTPGASPSATLGQQGAFGQLARKIATKQPTAIGG
jgi:hypothetical protein